MIKNKKCSVCSETLLKRLIVLPPRRGRGKVKIPGAIRNVIYSSWKKNVLPLPEGVRDTKRGRNQRLPSHMRFGGMSRARGDRVWDEASLECPHASENWHLLQGAEMASHAALDYFTARRKGVLRKDK